jgi:ABC-2 type transport system permease protein
MSLLSGLIANLLYPMNTDYEQTANALKNYNCQLVINRLSPYYLYTEAVSTILNPAVRAVNPVTVNQMIGAISGYLPFEQSLLLVWPHLVGLLALSFAAFTISYIGFMRQEVRGT